MMLKSDGAINSLALAISSGLNFLSIFLWTRLLDPHEFGIYALVLAAGLLLNAVAFEWLRLAGARVLYDPADPMSISATRASALFLLYAITAVLFAGVLVVLYLCGAELDALDAHWWPLIATLALTEMGLAIINTMSRVRQKPWQFFRSMVARSLLSISLGLFLIMVMGMGASGAILGVVVAQAVVALSSLVLDPLWRTIKPWRADLVELRRLLVLGAPLIVSCGLTYAAGVTDRFLIAFQLGAHDAGLYAAPVDLLQKTLVFVMMAINLTAYPALVRAYEDQGPEAASAMLERNFVIQLGLGLPATVGLCVLAPGIAGLMLGESFREGGAMLLPYIGVASLLRCLTTFHLMIAFQISGHMRLMLAPPAVMLVVLITAAVPMMREWGILGMAFAAIAAQAATYLITAMLARRAMRIGVLSPDTVKIAIAATVMGLALAPLRHEDGTIATILLIGGGGGLYLAALLLLRVSVVTGLVRGSQLARLLRRSRR